MITKKRKVTIFSNTVLKELPITYRLMSEMETNSVGELYTRSIFSNSKRHFSRSYKMYISPKPISNFLIKKE